MYFKSKLLKELAENLNNINNLFSTNKNQCDYYLISNFKINSYQIVTSDKQSVNVFLRVSFSDNKIIKMVSQTTHVLVNIDELATKKKKKSQY